MIVASCCLAAILLAGDALPADWPRFHGPRGDNVSQETGLLKSWPEGGPRRLWTARGIGEGYSSVSIGAGRIYTSGNLKDQTVITALGLDGRVRWQVPGGEAWTGPYPGTRGTPTVDGDRVYHESPLGQVVALDANDGREIWSINLLEEFESKNLTWGLSESVLVDGDRLICSPGGPHASVVALNKKTGVPIWAARPTGDLAGYATPVVIEHGGLRIILTMSQKALLGVNAQNGDLLFRHPHATRYDANATSPLFHDGRIFITSGYGAGAEMLELAVEGSRASVKRAWESKDLDNLHGGVLLLDGCLFGAAHEGPCRQTPWVSLDWTTGRTRHAAPSVGRGSLTCADRMLVVLSEDGRVGLAEALPGEHRLLGRFRLPPGGQGPTWAHPVVCGGRLYLRHGDALHAFDLRGEAR